MSDNPNYYLSDNFFYQSDRSRYNPEISTAKKSDNKISLKGTDVSSRRDQEISQE